MKYALISSIYDLDLVEEFDYHLLLAWACKNDIYKKFYQNLRCRSSAKDFIIMDNGANEKKTIIGDELIKIAMDLNSNEVQAPDFHLLGDKTVKMAKVFLSFDYPKLKEYNTAIMGIPQGRDFEDFKACWDWMLSESKINTIGLGYRNVLPSIKEEISHMSTSDWEDLGIKNVVGLQDFAEAETFKYTLSRLYFLRRKVNILDLAKAGKQIHLLGLWNPAELQYYKTVFTPEEQTVIRGCDSAAPIQAAQAYVEFDPEFGVRYKPKEYLDMFAPLGKKQREIAEKNIIMVKKWIKD